MYENAGFLVCQPYAPKFPFETWILPRTHRARFETSSNEDFALLSNALKSRDLEAECGARRPAVQLHPAYDAVRRGRSRALSLAHRAHAEPDAGGRLRMGLGLLHQPDAAGRGGQVPARDSRSDAHPPRRLRGRALLQDRGPRRRARRAAARAGGARTRGHRGDAALSLDRSRALRPGAPAARAGGAARRRHRRRRGVRGPGGVDAAGARVPHRSQAVVRSRRALRRRASGDFADNARRFALLGSAALAVCAEFGAWPDVVHGHDWQAGPAILFAKQRWGELRLPQDRLHPAQPRVSGIVFREGRRRARITPPILQPRRVRILRAGELLEGRAGVRRPIVDGEPDLRPRDPDPRARARFRRPFARATRRYYTAS